MGFENETYLKYMLFFSLLFPYSAIPEHAATLGYSLKPCQDLSPPTRHLPQSNETRKLSQDSTPKFLQ